MDYIHGVFPVLKKTDFEKIDVISYFGDKQRQFIVFCWGSLK